MDNDTSMLLKVAYLKGIQQAEREAGIEFEKDALLGRLAWGAVKGIGKGLGWGLNKTVGAAGRAAGRRAAALGTRAGRAITQKVAPEAAGGWGMLPWKAAKGTGSFLRELSPIGARNLAPAEGGSKLFHALTFGGRQLPAEMLRYGTMMGALGGLTEDPNKTWDWGGAARGFLGGAAGGAGWHLGGEAVKGILGAGLKTERFMGKGALGGFGTRARSILGAGEKGGKTIYDKSLGKTFGELWSKPHAVSGGRHIVDPSLTGLQGLGASAKDIGTKTLLGIPVAAGMLGGDVLAEEGVQQGLDALSGKDEQQPLLTPGYGALSPSSMESRVGYGTGYGSRYMR